MLIVKKIIKNKKTKRKKEQMIVYQLNKGLEAFCVHRSWLDLHFWQRPVQYIGSRLAWIFQVVCLQMIIFYRLNEQHEYLPIVCVRNWLLAAILSCSSQDISTILQPCSNQPTKTWLHQKNDSSGCSISLSRKIYRLDDTCLVYSTVL